jgi:acyl-lipid omega-6 desaturase (Delta-12 desaturase)
LYPVALLLAVAAAYAATLLLLLAVPWPLSILLTIPVGILIGMIFIIGHDASHNSLTRSRALNLVLSRLAFLPPLHASSLWDLSHNRTHHIHNNIRGIDYVWEPLSPADFRSLSLIRRGIYRFYRTPVGVAFYYLPALWAARLVVPWPSIIPRARLIYWFDTTLVLGFLALQIVGVIALGAAFGKSAWASVTIGVLLPFLVWNGFMSFVIFLHHTHPAVEWFADGDARAARVGSLTGTVRVEFPAPFRQLTLAIMEHSAHHHASGVPLYHLPAMQAALLAEQRLVSWRFSWRAYARICQRCKLYDYDAGRWVTFKESAR